MGRSQPGTEQVVSVDDIPVPYQVDDADALIAAAKSLEPEELTALVARIVIDSLGRPWNPILHPRDAHGRFIETFAEIRGLFKTSGGGRGAPKISGRVVAFDHNGDVWVRVDHVADGYTGHKPGDLVPIKPDDIEAQAKLATIPKALDDGQRSEIEALAARMEGRNPDAAAALRRAADPANTEPIAQLADLHEARDALDADGSPDAVAVRDAVWDLSDQLGDHPSNDEVLKAAQAMVRDHLAQNPTQNAEAIARLDRDIHAEAPAGQPSAPDAAQALAGQLYKVADRIQDVNPADAVHVRNVAAKLGEVGLTGETPERRDARLEAAATQALKINNANLKKKIVADIKHMRQNPPQEAAPAPERADNVPKARLEPPAPAAPLPAEPSPAPAAPDAQDPVEWARGVAKQGGGIKPHENPADATPEELRVRQAKVEAEIEALQKKAFAHPNALPLDAQAQRLDALVKEHDAIEARLAEPAPETPPVTPAPEVPAEPVAEVPSPPSTPPTDTPVSAAPDEYSPDDELELPDENVEAITPAVPAQLAPLGDLGAGIQWEDMPHGLVLRGNVFPHKDEAKAAGFRWADVPGEQKRDGAPLKAWTAIGTPEKRQEMLAKLADRLGLPDPLAAGDVEEEYPPTEQQQAIIDAVNTGQDVAVRALAGTGKTSTLKMIARRLFKSDPNKRIVYVAFNKSIQEEAQKTMPPNVEARTGDSIAYATLSPGMKDKFADKAKRALRRNADVAAFLGIKGDLDMGPGVKPMAPDEQAMRVMRAIEQYAISADDKLGVEHFQGMDPDTASKLLPYAEKAWEDINAEDGRLKLNFSHITKMWALSKPDFTKTTSGLKRKADIIFFDEAQDINPVMAKVIADQKIQKVYVGDSNQAIYAFRGAVDELDNVKVDHDLPLTKSWRFGPQIASMGNRFLAMLGSKHRIEGGGPEGKVVEPYTMTDPDAILVRSNAGAIGEILQAQTEGKVVGVPKGTKADLRKLVDTARWLQRGGPAPAQIHDDLAAFRNWDEVQKAAEAGDDPKVAMLAKIVEDTGIDKLNDLVERLVETGDNKDNRTPDMYVTTAHKAKGLEWDKVKIGADFRGPRLDKQTGELVMPSPEEMRLAYVAVTRAMKELDPGSLAWVYDWTDENGGTVKPETPSETTPPTSSPSSPSHWLPEGAELFPGEASRPLGPSLPSPPAQPSAHTSKPLTPAEAESWRDVPFDAEDDRDLAYAMLEPNPPAKLYHVAPQSARDAIEKNGLDASGQTWNIGIGGRDATEKYEDEWIWNKGEDGEWFRAEYRPTGVYMFSDEARARQYMQPTDDLYEIDTAANDREIIRDPSVALNWDYQDDEDKAYVTRYVEPGAFRRLDSAAPEAPKGVSRTPEEQRQIDDAIAGIEGKLPKDPSKWQPIRGNDAAGNPVPDGWAEAPAGYTMWYVNPEGWRVHPIVYDNGDTLYELQDPKGHSQIIQPDAGWDGIQQVIEKAGGKASPPNAPPTPPSPGTSETGPDTTPPAPEARVPSGPQHPGPTLLGKIIQAARDGGFTFDPRSKNFKTEGFAVARQGYGEHFSVDDPDVEAKIDAYIDQHWDTFQNDQGAYLGGWVNEGEIWLDVPDVLDSREDAIAEGTKRFEIAIADLAAYANGDDGEIRLQYAERPPRGTPAHNDWTDLEGVRHVEPESAADSAPSGAGRDEGPVQAPGEAGPGPDAAGDVGVVPDGWVENTDPFNGEPDGSWTKGDYTAFADTIDNPDGLRVVEFGEGYAVLWKVDAANWSEVEAKVAEHEALKDNGGLAQEERGKLAADADRLGLGPDLIDAIKSGTPDQIRAALDQDEHYAELRRAFQNAMAEGADQWDGPQERAIADWFDINGNLLLKLREADLLTGNDQPDLSPQEAPDARVPAAPEVPTAPEVPAYSGELRPIQPRDLGEMLNAVDNAQEWMSSFYQDRYIRPGNKDDLAIYTRLNDALDKLRSGIDGGDYDGAQRALDEFRDEIGAPDVDPDFTNDMSEYVTQIQGVLDKVNQRDKGQFEIPGVAQPSVAPFAEHINPEGNAAFDDMVQHDPDVARDVKDLNAALLNLERAIQEGGDEGGLADMVRAVRYSLNNRDYQAVVNVLPGIVDQHKFPTPWTDRDITPEPRYSNYFEHGVVEAEARKFMSDWGDMLAANAPEQPATPDVPASQEPLQSWEKALLDGFDKPEVMTPDMVDAANEVAQKQEMWRNIVAQMDGELGGTYMGDVYNAVIQDRNITKPDQIEAVVARQRSKYVAEGDQPAVDIIDRIIRENQPGPQSNVPGPYDPAASPEAVMPDAPGDGTPIKDENRVIDARVRGEIEDVKRGVGLPELPDRLDYDRNGVAVFALDLVDVPAAGKQGKGDRRRPPGIGQVRRIYVKNGVTYAEVAFYDPAFVDYPNRNRVKAAAGIKNGSPFYVWDGIRLDKIQKVDGSNPDAVEFLGHLGPEEARQYAGRNAGRLAQNRGRVRPELERMANLQYIGDRYVPDANGLPVGKGDVVLYNGKKYEVARVNNDNPGVGNNVRLDLVPLGADGEPEIQAGGKHAEPYARMVQFYDQPLGDRKPAVTVDELKDLVRRLDADKKYAVGQAVHDALENGDLKEIARAFNEDPAILTYVADGRAYINDYIGRLLNANLRGNFDAINQHEQEMVRKDKNDLLNAMAALDGRFLEGTGADRHIRRAIPDAGPDREYKGNQPEVLMPLNYVKVKDAVAKERAAHPEDDGLWATVQDAIARAGALNLDDEDNYWAALREFEALRQSANAGLNAPDLGDALGDLMHAMDAWHQDQEKRRAIRQGGPGAEAQLPAGRTIAPGLVRPPAVPSNRPVPAPQSDADRAYADKLGNDPMARFRYMNMRNDLQAMADAADDMPELRDYLDEANRALINGNYGEGYHAIENVLGIPADHPNAGQLARFQDRLAQDDNYVRLGERLRAIQQNDWPNNFFPDTVEINAGKAPAAPAAPAVPQKPAVDMPDHMREHIKNRIDRVMPQGAKDAADALNAGMAPNAPDLEALHDAVDKGIARGNNATEYQEIKDWLDTYAPRAGAAPATPDSPVAPSREPADVRKAIADAVEAKYEELRADRKNNEARKKALAVQDAGDAIDAALDRAIAYHGGDGADDIDTRDTEMRSARDAVAEIRAVDPAFASELDSMLDEINARFNRDDDERIFQRYLDEARKFHDADKPDNDQRDRMIRAARDQAARVGRADNARGAELEAQIKALEDQFAADDIERARAKPVGRTEAIDNFDAEVAAERKRLRDAGKAAEARKLVQDADAVAEALNDAEDAHKAGDKDARDAAIEKARVAAEELDASSPDIAEIARRAVEGNAARFARADAGGGLAGPIEVEPGAARTRIDIPDGPEGSIEAAAHAFLGLSQSDIADIYRGRRAAPAGYSVEYMGGGCVGGTVKLVHLASKKKFVIKSDNISPLGLEAEEDVATLYRALGFAQPKVYRLRAQNDGRDIIMMDWAGVEQKAKHVKLYANMFGYYGPSLGELELADEDDAIRAALANAIVGQTDRHGANIYWGKDSKGHGMPIFIDNGLALFNGGHRDTNDTTARDNSKRPWEFNPMEILFRVNGANRVTWNQNANLTAATERAGQIDETKLKETISEWAARMRDEAMKREQEFRNDATATFVARRAQWIIDNVDDVAEALRTGRWVHKGNHSGGSGTY